MNKPLSHLTEQERARASAGRLHTAAVLWRKDLKEISNDIEVLVEAHLTLPGDGRWVSGIRENQLHLLKSALMLRIAGLERVQLCPLCGVEMPQTSKSECEGLGSKSQQKFFRCTECGDCWKRPYRADE